MQLGIYRETVAVLLLFLVILGQIKQTGNNRSSHRLVRISDRSK